MAASDADIIAMSGLVTAIAEQLLYNLPQYKTAIYHPGEPSITVEMNDGRRLMLTATMAPSAAN